MGESPVHDKNTPLLEEKKIWKWNFWGRKRKILTVALLNQGRFEQLSNERRFFFLTVVFLFYSWTNFTHSPLVVEIIYVQFSLFSLFRFRKRSLWSNLLQSKECFSQYMKNSTLPETEMYILWKRKKPCRQIPHKQKREMFLLVKQGSVLKTK